MRLIESVMKDEKLMEAFEETLVSLQPVDEAKEGDITKFTSGEVKRLAGELKKEAQAVHKTLGLVKKAAAVHMKELKKKHGNLEDIEEDKQDVYYEALDKMTDHLYGPALHVKKLYGALNSVLQDLGVDMEDVQD